MNTAMTEQLPAAETQTGVYVYGICWESAELPDGLPAVGVAEPGVRTLGYGKIAALVSDVNVQRPLGTRADLLAHKEILDGVAERTTVLPLRFGAVLANADAVADELLAPNEEHFARVLAELDGLVEFTLRGHYVDDAHLREIIAERTDINDLRSMLRDLPQEQGYAERVRLGELISGAVEAKREADHEAVLEALSGRVTVSARHRLADVDEAVALALLVERSRIPAFEKAIDGLGADTADRLAFQLAGPFAPYDFLPREWQWA